MLFIAVWPVLPFGEPEGLGQAAKHDLALFFNSILLRQPRADYKILLQAVNHHDADSYKKKIKK